MQAPSAPALLALRGPSGVGKTTLLEALLPVLQSRGLRVGTLKHSRHPHPIDKPGSDSHRHLAAGAARAAFLSGAGLAVFEAGQPYPDRVFQRVFADCDLVLVEGWRERALPFLQLHRPGLPRPDDVDPGGMRLAWVGEAAGPGRVLPAEAGPVADFVMDWLGSGAG